MLPTFDFLVKIDEIHVTSRHFGKMWGTLPTKEKEELIKREFWVYVPHLKGGNIVWTCVKDNIIEEKYDHKAIELRCFNYKLFEEE